MKALALGAFTLLLVACAVLLQPERDLAPGMSMPEVEAKMGKPKETLVDSAGATVWFYTTAPDDRRATWAARFARDGRLQDVEQRLTRENIARVVPGMSKKQVRELLGPPWQAYPVARLPYVEWDYRVFAGGLLQDLLIRFSTDGVVHDSSLLHDSRYDRGP